jgi:hypothetical protein
MTLFRRHNRYFLRQAAILSLMVIVASCGRSKQKVDIQDNSSMRSDTSGPTSVKDPNCTASSCAAAEFSLVDDSGRDLSSITLSGKVGVPVSWKLRVKSASSPGRVRIAVTESLLWMKKESAGEPGGIDIIGTPTDSVRDNFILVIARDMTRCALKQTSKECTDVSKSFPDCDKSIKIKYTISDSSSSP